MGDEVEQDDVEVRRAVVLLQKRDTDHIPWRIAIEKRLKDVPKEVLEAAKDRLKGAADEVEGLYHRVKGDDKESEKDPGEQAEELTKQAKRVLEVGEAAFDHIAEQAQQRNDTEGLKKAREAAEQFKQGAERLEAGEQLIAKANKAAKVLRQLEAMKKAGEALRDNDLSDPAQQKRGAEALDELFSGAGDLASELLPDGPWSEYFTFLKGFKEYNFFGHWADFIHDYTQRAYEAADSDR